MKHLETLNYTKQTKRNTPIKNSQSFNFVPQHHYTSLNIYIMACYSVLDVAPTVEDWIPAYLSTANSLITQHDGKYWARTTGSVSHHYLIEAKDEFAGKPENLFLT